MQRDGIIGPPDGSKPREVWKRPDVTVMTVFVGRPARIPDMMQRDGIIGPPDGSKPREVWKRPDVTVMTVLLASR
jgi:DNA segregation ATPase FtsK/SpoIIIE-like protein